jgi:phosphatidylglycerophosphatase A
LQEIFLTLFYSGYSKKAPGTVGSFVALILAIPILKYLSLETLFLLAILITLIAIKQIDIYETQTNTHDNSIIVIDELVGMWITIAIAGILWNDILGLLLSFIMFRIYDIKKISIVRRIDENVKGGLGVMGDDIAAGVLAGLSTALILYVIQIMY